MKILKIIGFILIVPVMGVLVIMTHMILWGIDLWFDWSEHYDKQQENEV